MHPQKAEAESRKVEGVVAIETVATETKLLGRSFVSIVAIETKLLPSPPEQSEGIWIEAIAPAGISSRWKFLS